MGKAVIFDFNGTLLWDTALHNQAWDVFLQKHRIGLSDADKARVIHGKTNNDIFRELFRRDFDAGALQELSEEKEAIYRGLCVQTGIQLADGAIGLFEFCRAKAIPFAIATSSYRENAEFFIDRFGLLSWFDPGLVIYNDGTIRSKPDPEIFAIAMARMGRRPQDVVIFEDSISGIQAAAAARAGRIVIVNSSRDDYSAYRHQVIHDLTEFDRDSLLS
jgi:beta-phosphoglucomutase-like phosphatase (HAD superfamily)